MTILVCAGLGYVWYTQQQPAITTPESQPQPAADASASKALRPVLRDTAMDDAPQTPQPAVPATSTTMPEIVAAPADLNQSDSSTLAAARDIQASLVQWLTPQEQLRKWVLLVDNLAAGKVPLKNRPFQFEITQFTVSGSESAPQLASTNYSRLEPLVSAFEKLDPQQLGYYYRAWSPRLEEAYAEMGEPGSFHHRLLEAIDRVLAVEPLPDTSIKLQQPSVLYTYANADEEQASAVEKLLWRMGPDNSKRIQTKLRAIRGALGQP